jgi:adenylate cyclase
MIPREHDMAILMADLSGYTALTEMHGAMSAARLVTKYLELVDRSLFGTARLLERVGDQVVVVADKANDLAVTAINLLSNAGNEASFLPIHAGIHYGKILEQDGSFFGSAINLTARITGMATDGSLLCSAAFVSALEDKDRFQFERRGEFRFKNVSKPVEIFELQADEFGQHLAVDPVCYMQIERQDNQLNYSDRSHTYYFCSVECLNIFKESINTSITAVV